MLCCKLPCIKVLDRNRFIIKVVHSERSTPARVRTAGGGTAPERNFFMDNLLVRIHFVIETIWWTGLAPWESEFPFPGSLISTFQRLARRGRGACSIQRLLVVKDLFVFRFTRIQVHLIMLRFICTQLYFLSPLICMEVSIDLEVHSMARKGQILALTPRSTSLKPCKLSSPGSAADLRFETRG